MFKLVAYSLIRILAEEKAKKSNKKINDCTWLRTIMVIHKFNYRQHGKNAVIKLFLSLIFTHVKMWCLLSSHGSFNFPQKSYFIKNMLSCQIFLKEQWETAYKTNKIFINSFNTKLKYLRKWHIHDENSDVWPILYS